MTYKSFIFLPLTFLSLSTFAQATLYENAENGKTNKWIISDKQPSGANIKNIFDTTKNSKVIQFSGANRSNSYTIGARSGINTWTNSKEKHIKWSMNFAEKFKISIYTQTAKGQRVLSYDYKDYDKGLYRKKHIRLGLGKITKTGTWIDIERDLEADLKKYDPSNKILSINGFKIQGSGKIDNLELFSKGGGNENGNANIIEDASDGKTTGWTIFDNTPNGASIKNTFDTQHNSKVIEVKGAGRTNSYQLGAERGASAWNDTTHNSISWDMKFNEKYKLFILTNTKKGPRRFFFTHSSKSKGLYKTKYVRIGLTKKSINGTWQTFSVNLEKELKKYEPNNNLLSINGLRVQGSGRFDNIKLSANGTTPPVGDTQAPVITLKGSSKLSLKKGSPYNELGATALDNKDGVVYVKVTGNVNTNIVGTYIINYYATDKANNKTNRIRTVKVTDNSNTTTINVPNDYATIREAVAHAKNGDTIILEPGTHIENGAITISQDNLTIASKYLTTGDKKYIASTILKGLNDKNIYMFNGHRVKGHSRNLRFIGLTAKNTGKFITFTYGDNNLVDHCILDHIKRDAVSFDSAATGKVMYSKFYNSGDDAIDVDTNKGTTGGGFEFAHNEIYNSFDDAIEIHLWYYNNVEKIKKTMHFNIHDNLIKNSGDDAIQLIDFDKTQDYAGVDPHKAIDKVTKTNRSFEIHNNIFRDNGQVAIGAIFQSSQHKDSDRPSTRHFSGANMGESISIHDNTFLNNAYHILGGDNMQIKNNSFKGASAVAIKRVKGKSTINNNTFSNNKKNFENSNK